jgi:uncharacterized lipoprotein YddW (UPF0748 family)
VRRYDVDGIHIDDYFYPYPIQTPDGLELDFPDQPAWLRYRSAGGQASRPDWRRQQVNQLIEQVYSVIHQEKPWVRFGISPFGLGQAGRRPAGITGFSQYDKLYADAELWLNQGWLDYFSPQLYWPIDQAPQAFPVLLQAWAVENVRQRHLWPGLFTSRIDGSNKSWPVEEIARQIDITRRHGGAGGHIHFSMVALLQNRQGIATLLKSGVYATPALVPATPWLGAEVPPAPRLSLKRSELAGGPDILTVESENGPAISQFAVWKRYPSKWLFSVLPANNSQLAIAADPELGKPHAVVMSSVNRLGIESSRTWLHLQP